jgi:16S rRNA (uracil1498-N3)-methyltransferase
MRRFFVEEINGDHRSCSITGSEAKHITRVLRMVRGDRFILMDGRGARFLALIESASPQEVRVALKRPLPSPTPSPVEIILCQALLKSRNMDYLIQKTSELGVDRIFPFSSKRTLIRLGRDRVASRMRHWREIAHSAAKQSDRITPAEIGPPFPFKDLITKCNTESALKVILWEEEGAKDLKRLLRTSSPAHSFIGLIGPEGGFAHEEVKAAGDAGFISCSLGNRVLRSETAAIAMVALVQYELGDLSLGNPRVRM